MKPPIVVESRLRKRDVFFWSFLYQAGQGRMFKGSFVVFFLATFPLMISVFQRKAFAENYWALGVLGAFAAFAIYCSAMLADFMAYAFKIFVRERALTNTLLQTRRVFAFEPEALSYKTERGEGRVLFEKMHSLFLHDRHLVLAWEGSGGEYMIPWRDVKADDLKPLKNNLKRVREKLKMILRRR